MLAVHTVWDMLSSSTNQAFDAVGALATIALFFQHWDPSRDAGRHQEPGVKEHLQGVVDAVYCGQFTVSSAPFFLLTIAGYWAYGNLAFPYMLISLSGPKWAITLADVTAILQALVVFHVRGARTLGPYRMAWHKANIIVNVVVTLATVAAALHYIIHDASMYHAFTDI